MSHCLHRVQWARHDARETGTDGNTQRRPEEDSVKRILRPLPALETRKTEKQTLGDESEMRFGPCAAASRSLERTRVPRGRRGVSARTIDLLVGFV